MNEMTDAISLDDDTRLDVVKTTTTVQGTQLVKMQEKFKGDFKVSLLAGVLSLHIPVVDLDNGIGKIIVDGHQRHWTSNPQTSPAANLLALVVAKALARKAGPVRGARVRFCIGSPLFWKKSVCFMETAL